MSCDCIGRGRRRSPRRAGRPTRCRARTRPWRLVSLGGATQLLVERAARCSRGGRDRQLPRMASVSGHGRASHLRRGIHRVQEATRRAASRHERPDQSDGRRARGVISFGRLLDVARYLPVAPLSLDDLDTQTGMGVGAWIKRKKPVPPPAGMLAAALGLIVPRSLSCTRRGCRSARRLRNSERDSVTRSRRFEHPNASVRSAEPPRRGIKRQPLVPRLLRRATSKCPSRAL